jgi:hypothetical protein
MNLNICKKCPHIKVDLDSVFSGINYWETYYPGMSHQEFTRFVNQGHGFCSAINKKFSDVTNNDMKQCVYYLEQVLEK